MVAAHCVCVICVSPPPAFLHPAPHDWDEGALTACLTPKKKLLPKKSASFCRFFIKNGKFWCIRMKGTREGGTPQSRQQGARASRAKGQRAGGGGSPWVHGLTGVPSEGIGMVGRCSPASHPASHPAISSTTLPCNGDDVPTPTSVPGRAVASTHTAAPPGRWDDVGGAGGKGEEHRAHRIL